MVLESGPVRFSVTRNICTRACVCVLARVLRSTLPFVVVVGVSVCPVLCLEVSFLESLARLFFDTTMKSM